jgi:hypothetical protein
MGFSGSTIRADPQLPISVEYRRNLPQVSKHLSHCRCTPDITLCIMELLKQGHVTGLTSSNMSEKTYRIDFPFGITVGATELLPDPKGVPII